MRARAASHGLSLTLDSAGTGDWHLGAPPDRRAVAAAAARRVDISQQRARQVTAADFGRFDLILGMDTANIAALERLRPAGSETPVTPFLHFAPGHGTDLPDPYIEGDFDGVLDMVEAACDGLLGALEREISPGRPA